MITYNFRKHIKELLGLCLIIFALTSCTYDYFGDENNFRLYVPQIEDGSIRNFYVAFHTEDGGGHTITRELTAPFDHDELMQQGILRFKLPPGKRYTISCFADYTPGSITIGNEYAESYKTKHTVDATSSVYAVRNSTPRSAFSSALAYPIGHPDALVAHEVSIDETGLFKGRVILSFIELPAEISRVDMYCYGLSTAYHVDGSFRRFAPEDCILGSYICAEHTRAATTEFSTFINPSAGTEFGGASPTRAGVRAPTPVSLELRIHLYDAGGNVIGVIPFTESDFHNLAPEKKPVDKDGATVSDLVLRSQETIKFTFKGFTLIKIDLVGWGDIIPGGTTPM